jgi:hypothetical protein
MPLARLVYYSENVLANGKGGAFAALADIMDASKRNNRPAGITGALIVDHLWFLQMLEGERTAVWNTFKRLDDDERHANVVLCEMREVETRLFANWWMGLVRLDEATRARISRHLVGGQLRPDAMSAGAILDLMSDIASLSLAREMAAAA